MLYMCAVIRRETVVPKATGWAENKKERKGGFEGEGCFAFALMHLCRKGSNVRAGEVRATQASEI